MPDTKQVSTVEIRERLSDMINRVAYGKDRLTLTRRKKPIAAIVPLEDLELLEKIEDSLDLLVAMRELENLEEQGIEPTPWEQVRKKAGLTD